MPVIIGKGLYDLHEQRVHMAGNETVKGVKGPFSSQKALLITAIMGHANKIGRFMHYSRPQ